MNPDELKTNKSPQDFEVHLTKKPKNPIIIEGFPGFGLVGTIATEFLVEHLKTEEIGKVWFEDLPAVIAIHDSKIVNPIGIFYNEKYNIVIVHSISGTSGVEWRTANVIMDIAKDLEAKEVICLEGIGSTKMVEKPEKAGENEKNDNIGDIKAFYCGNNQPAEEKLTSLGVGKLNESIIMGIVPALILKNQANLTCIFAETETNLPDSKAAARIIQILDKYLGLEVDYKPLIEMAEKLEGKLKNILEKSQQVAKQRGEKVRPNYFG